MKALEHEHNSLEGASQFFTGKESLQNQLDSGAGLCQRLMLYKGAS